VAGLDPLSSGSTFTFLTAQAGGSRLITFGPLTKGTTYTVKRTDALASGVWTSLQTVTPASATTSMTVTDTTVLNSNYFYTVGISKP
jgi:hypothetical protein